MSNQKNHYEVMDVMESVMPEPWPELPEEMWRTIFGFVSDNDLVNLCAVSKRFQEIVRAFKSRFDLNRCHRLNTNFLLNFALSEKCSGLDIDHCRWLKAGTILEIISKTKLRHLSIVHCQINEECVRAVCDLPLESLSFLYDWKWQSYFQSRSPQLSIPCLENLKNLSVLYCAYNCYTLDLQDLRIIHEIFKYILIHCKEVENLRLLEFMFNDLRSENENEYLIGNSVPMNFFLLEPFLPKLRSLVVDINSCDDFETITNFMTVILKDRIIPLEHVDLGRFTSELLINGLLFHPQIQEKENFLLSCSSINIRNLDEIEGLDELIVKQGPFRKLRFQNVGLNRFADLISKILINSRESIQEVVLKHSSVDESALQGIQLLAINCPQITILDLKISNWMKLIGENDIVDGDYTKYTAIEKNIALLETISHFKNLQKLSIGDCFLACDYYKPDPVRKFHKAMPFWKVTKGCEQLEQISIKCCSSTIHMDSIYDIAHCKKLTVFKISRVQIRGGSDFDLSKITKSCSQLKQLVVYNIGLHAIGDSAEPKLIVENNLSFAKNLQCLKIELDSQSFNKTFINSLNECPNLEKINLYLQNYNVDDMLYFANLLPKFKSLFQFKLSGDDVSYKLLTLVCLYIQIEKPTFFYDILLSFHYTCSTAVDYDEDYSEYEN